MTISEQGEKQSRNRVPAKALKALKKNHGELDGETILRSFLCLRQKSRPLQRWIRWPLGSLLQKDVGTHRLGHVNSFSHVHMWAPM